MLATQALVLAHGGGAPEALTISVPLVVVLGLVLAERRARRRERDTATDETDIDK